MIQEDERPESYFVDLNQTLGELELKSPVLLGHEYDFKIAEMDQLVARSDQGLKFGVTVYGQSIHEDRPSESFYHRYRALNQVYLKKPIFHWGALEAQEEIAKLNKDRSWQSLSFKKSTLKSEVRAVFLELVVLKFRIKLAGSQIELAKENVNTAKERFRLGRGTQLEIDEAKAELISREISLSETKSSLQRKHSYFTSISGNNEELSLEIPDRFKSFCLTHEMQSNLPIQVGSLSSGEVEDLKLQSKIQDQAVLIANAALKPKINLTSAYFQDQIDIAESGKNLDRNNLIVGLEAHWEIWDSGKSKAQKKSAILRKSKINESIILKQKQVRSHVNTMLEELDSLAERIALGRKLIEVAQSRFDKSKLELNLNRIAPMSHFGTTVSLDKALLNNLEITCRYLVLLDQYANSVSLVGPFDAPSSK
jgi:outer membrane protein TolC